MIGASAALAISGIPFRGPIGACRVGYINDEIVINPTTEELKTSASTSSSPVRNAPSSWLNPRPTSFRKRRCSKP